MKHYSLTVVLFASLLVAGSPLLAKQPGPGGREAYPGRQAAGAYIDLNSAAATVRERMGGRILSAHTNRLNGGSVHVIRVITDDGKVHRVSVDAQSGQVLD